MNYNVHQPARRTVLAVGIGGLLAGLTRKAAAVEAPVRQGLAVAEAYVRAYSGMDSAAMAPWMTEDFVFADRTSIDAGRPVEGRAAVLALIDRLRANGLTDLGLDLPSRFESNGVAVFSGTVNSISRSSPGAEALRWSARSVLVLTVRGAQVSKHEDFADYPGATITRVGASAE